MSKNPFCQTPFPDFRDIAEMSKKERTEEAGLLREAIGYHDHLYYVKNDPEISDSKYDRLFQRLLDLEEAEPDLRSDDSPTTRVGAPPLDELKKREHLSTMLSIDSSDRAEKVEQFVRRMEKETGGEVVFVAEPKFYGLSMEIVYEKGSFSYAATRGDGSTGEEVSDNVKTIRSVPLQLRNSEEIPERLSVRGEVFMGKKGFQALNKEKVEKGEKPFANARNATAGLIRQLDPGKVAGKPLEIYFYEVIDSSGSETGSHLELLDRFREWGLRTCDEYRKCRSFDEIRKFFDRLNEKREELPYAIDGMVIKLDDRSERSRIGTRQRSPRWAFAWKFQPRKEMTTLQEITVQVGRTGILTPVALLEPVEVGGVTVSRATLHNMDEIEKKDVRTGDTVRVIRAGDVIPEIAGRVKKPGRKRGDPFKMPDQCPVCGTGVVREGSYYLCPAGLTCDAQLKGRLTHFASRDAMDIRHLGEGVVSQLVDREMIGTIPDLYRLQKEQLEELDGFAEKSAEKLYKAVQDSKSVELYRFLYAVGIRNVGSHLARLLAAKLGSLERLRKVKKEQLSDIGEIGPEVAESITHFFSDSQNRQMLDELEKLGLEITNSLQERNGELSGKTFVLTGSLEGYTRQEATDQITSRGGRVTSSVSDETDFVVAGEEPGQKLDNARERNIRVLDENQFNDLLKE